MRLLAVAVEGRGVVDPAEPVFPATDEALLRGSAAFETIRVRARHPVLLDEHVARLERSAAALRLPEARDATRLAVQAVAAAGVDEAVLRLYRTEAALVATVAALPAGLEALRARGIALASVRGLPTELLAGVKATSYAFNFAARVTPGRTPAAADGVERTSPSRHQTFAVDASSTSSPGPTSSASSAPARSASARAAKLNA